MDANAEVYATLVILFVALVVSFAGNILVMTSAVLHRELRNNTGLLIMNLSISDLCISCFSLPLRLCQMLGFDWSDDFTSCGVTVGFTIFFFTASNFNLFLVTLDRFLGVLWPIKYRLGISRRKVNIAISCSWLLACIIAFFPKFAVGEQENENMSKLKFICTFGTVLHPAYLIFMEVFTLFIPWFLMILMYSGILKTVFNSANTEPSRISSKKKLRRSDRKILANRHRMAKEIKLAKGVFIIIIIYSVLMVPIAFIDLLELIGSVKVPLTAIRVTVLMAYLNPAVNPPVYAATSKKYKDAFARIFSCSSIIENARRLFASKVVRLDKSFDVENGRQKSRKNKVSVKSSTVPNASSDNSCLDDYSSFTDSQAMQSFSLKINPKEARNNRNHAVPIFTITEEVETNFIRPKPIFMSTEEQDVSEYEIH